MSVRRELSAISNFHERTDEIISTVLKADEKAEAYAAELGDVLDKASPTRQAEVAEAFLQAAEVNEVIAGHNQRNHERLNIARRGACFFPRTAAPDKKTISPEVQKLIEQFTP